MPNSQISHETRVEAVIRAACRRRLLVLALEQLAVALAVVLGGGILMLLLGTRILDWYWLALLAFPCLALAWVRTRGRALPPYRVAQIVDHRLHLSDSLSTAWFLLSTVKAEHDPIARFQIRRAEDVAREVKPARAFPLNGRRTWALTGAMGAVVFGLFAIRCLVVHSLNFEQALLPIHLDAPFNAMERSLSADNRQPDGVMSGGNATKSERGGARNDDGFGEATGIQDAPGRQNGFGRQAQALSPDSQANRRATQGQGRSMPSAAGQPSFGDGAQQVSDNPNGSKPDQNNKEQTADQQGSSGLIDRMKDALSSLMAKMRPNQNVDKRPQSSDRSESQKNEDQTSGSSDQPNPQQDARNEQSRQDQNSQAEAQTQATERAQGSQSRDSERSAERGSDAHSGIGRQDGNKDLNEAEQLQAMGKLAEIIGKRSASLTGDIMVETSSGNQQLKTAYSQRLGHHADLGGEINRDQIPLADQQYIREYMELVRKQGESGR